MANRVLKNSKANPEKIDSHDAFNKTAARKQDLDKALEDPQPGPVEKRDTIKRATRRY